MIKMTKEKLIEEIMREAARNNEPLTYEDAAEIARLEIADKERRHYETSDKPRKPIKKERKIDSAKLYLINTLLLALNNDEEITVTDVKTETEIALEFGGVEYSLKLIRHRPEK